MEKGLTAEWDVQTEDIKLWYSVVRSLRYPRERPQTDGAGKSGTVYGYGRFVHPQIRGLEDDSRTGSGGSEAVTGHKETPVPPSHQTQKSFADILALNGI